MLGARKSSNKRPLCKNNDSVLITLPVYSMHHNGHSPVISVGQRAGVNVTCVISRRKLLRGSVSLYTVSFGLENQETSQGQYVARQWYRAEGAWNPL